MANDPRYSSGTCLDRTSKEMLLDNLEAMLADISDDLYIGLKKLTIPQIRELLRLVNGVCPA